MKPLFPFLALVMTSCTTIKTPTVTLETAGHIKALTTLPDGTFQVEEITSPLDGLMRTATMLGAALGIIR